MFIRNIKAPSDGALSEIVRLSKQAGIGKRPHKLQPTKKPLTINYECFFITILSDKLKQMSVN